MNISINNVNFSGKREVLYGLNLAANEAKNAEICRALMQGPRPLNRAAEGKASEAISKAYMHMVTYDDSFYNTLKECNAEEIKDLKNILKAEKLQYAEINPLSLFKKTMMNSLKKHNKTIDVETLNNFFAKITDKRFNI